MPIRPFSFPSDFSVLKQLTPQAYQYPAETGWVTRNVQEQEAKNFVDTLRAAERLWLLIALGQRPSARLRNSAKGFIWEEEGQPVGLVATGEGAKHAWWIANLAVLPAYRRRGNAHRLVQAAVGTARSLGGESLTLDVVAENIPAYQLYQRLGFEPYNSSVELLAPEAALPPVSAPSGYHLRVLKAGEWQPHFHLAQRVTPAEVQRYRPITIERFWSSAIEQALNRILEPASGIRRGGIAAYQQGNSPLASAQFTARTRPGGVHELNLRIDPEHPMLAACMLSAGISRLQEIHPSHPVHIHVYSWQAPLVEAALEMGCTKVQTYITMGMKLAQEKTRRVGLSPVD